MRFITKTECKLFVSNDNINVLSTSTIKSFFPTYVRLCSWVYPLQLNDFKFTVGSVQDQMKVVAILGYVQVGM